MNNISQCLLFKDRALEAAKFYVAIFPRSRIVSVSRYGKLVAGMAGRKPGSVLAVRFILSGRPYMALNGPTVRANMASSLVVPCRTQKEIDHYWKRLTSGGGRASVCGWLTDKFGFSWQVAPARLSRWERGPAAAHDRMLASIVRMRKLDLRTMEAAYRGR